ncbi:hypothetical protein [Saccharopolyspora hattusasensis]|uniref:hypothetical protein n=1 Tax=Saccharopolyspora hattusasensis TaxID=1128679 RepID=UPI003D9A09DB
MSVIIGDPEHLVAPVEWRQFRHPAVTSPLHLAVLVRLGLYTEESQTRDEISEEFVARGWCTHSEFESVMADLCDGGLVRTTELVSNPARHTGDDCPWCAQHAQEFVEAWPRYERARARWDAGLRAYPFAPAARKLHRASCRHGFHSDGPLPPATSLRAFAHPQAFLANRRFVPPGWTDDPSTHTYDPGQQLSVREARAWILARTGPQGGRRWQPCKICRPVDPFLVDLPDEDVMYAVPTAPGLTIPVRANGALVRQLMPALGGSQWFGRSGDPGLESAHALLLDALGGAQALKCQECLPEGRNECGCRNGTVWLPLEDCHTEIIDVLGPEDSVSRAELRLWLDQWYRQHPDRQAPTVLAQVLDRDLLVRTDLAEDLLLV